MNNTNGQHVVLVSRLMLGFLFIYHGLVPKILWLSDIEVQLMDNPFLHLPASVFSPIAGVAEIVLGLVIIFFRRAIMPVYVAVFALVALLVLVAMLHPRYLIEAFNPVTTNLLGLGFCYFIICFDRKEKSDDPSRGEIR